MLAKSLHPPVMHTRVWLRSWGTPRASPVHWLADQQYGPGRVVVATRTWCGNAAGSRKAGTRHNADILWCTQASHYSGWCVSERFGLRVDAARPTHSVRIEGVDRGGAKLQPTWKGDACNLLRLPEIPPVYLRQVHRCTLRSPPPRIDSEETDRQGLTTTAENDATVAAVYAERQVCAC